VLITSNSAKCYKIRNLSDEEATLIEPAACAIHGMDKLKMPFGVKVLLIGAGPTGLILAQLMKMGGASHITVAANKGESRPKSQTSSR
jgi:D-arabinitol dehydrogenase (NADP+)